MLYQLSYSRIWSRMHSSWIRLPDGQNYQLSCSRIKRKWFNWRSTVWRTTN